MGMNVGSDDEDGAVMSNINTTPLVDIMLVLLIVFLITIPVSTRNIEVNLPVAVNEQTVTAQNNIVLSVDKKGNPYIATTRVRSQEELVDKLVKFAKQKKQPQVQIRADEKTKYLEVGKLVSACQEAGISHVDFITQEPHKG
ncbi:biopolymer transporter ExbD [Acetobacteraceae bacterium]|nr:biopolymer transporter ExbD [Acetobacteraceae bacterium]